MRLQVAGKSFTGFDVLSVIRSIDTIADGFSISSITNFPTQLPFTPFGYERVHIYEGNTLLMTGTVDIVEISRAADGAQVLIEGRSITSALIDSSISTTREWEGKSIIDIARELAAPFGINVEGSAGIPFERATASYGEKIGAFLQRLAGMQGVIIRSTPNGILRIESVTAGIPIERWTDNNSPTKIKILANGTDRYSDYVMVRTGADGVAQKGIATDTDVRLPRLLYTKAPAQTPNLTQAANFLRNRHKQALSIEVELPSLSSKDGSIYADSQAIEITLAELGVRGRFIIQESVLTEGADGSYAFLKLVPADTYEQ